MSKKLFAVFGATGYQGGSVVRALLKNGSYHVKAITRNPNSEKALKLSGLENVTVVKADLDDVETIEKALEGCYGVFIVTDFTAHLAKSEVKHGVNAIDSAIKNGLSHVVFSGLENVESIMKKPCLHFDYKAEIENYGLKNYDKINFTSVRLPCYYENFIGHSIYKLEPNKYLVNIPIQNTKFYGMSVDDIGECVVSVLEKPEEYNTKLIGLAGDILNLNEYIAIMNKHLAPNIFIDSHLTVEKYANLPFPGAKDLAVMFEYIQTGIASRDIGLTKQLNKNLLTFEEWILKNKSSILSTLQ